MHLYIKEHSNFYIHNIHANGIKKTEYTNVSQKLEIYTCCSVNEQLVEEIQIMEKDYLTSKTHTTMWLHHSLAE